MPAPPHHLHAIPAGTHVTDDNGIRYRLLNVTQVELSDWSMDALNEQLEYDKRLNAKVKEACAEHG